MTADPKRRKMTKIPPIEKTSFLSRLRSSDQMSPDLIGFSILQNPCMQIFMLSARCAHLRQKLSPIRPTISFDFFGDFLKKFPAAKLPPKPT